LRGEAAGNGKRRAVRPRITTARMPLAAGLPTGGGRRPPRFVCGRGLPKPAGGRETTEGWGRIGDG
jgi:hypothetical protein